MTFNDQTRTLREWLRHELDALPRTVTLPGYTPRVTTNQGGLKND